MWPITMIYPEAMEDSPVLHNEKARLTTSFFVNNLLNRSQTLSRLSGLLFYSLAQVG